MRHPHGETVIIQHPVVGAGPGDDGEPVPDTYLTESIPFCAVQPGDSRENNVRQSTVEVLFTVYLPADTVVEAAARIEVRGVVYEVEGPGEVWQNPFTGERPGVVAHLIRSQ